MWFLHLPLVSSPSALVVYPSDRSLDSVLVSIELLLCEVSSNPSTTESWPSIDQEIPSTVWVLSKRALHVLDFSVSSYIPVIGP